MGTVRSNRTVSAKSDVGNVNTRKLKLSSTLIVRGIKSTVGIYVELARIKKEVSINIDPMLSSVSLIPHIELGVWSQKAPEVNNSDVIPNSQLTT